MSKWYYAAGVSLKQVFDTPAAFYINIFFP
jgi:hypothetical protein